MPSGQTFRLRRHNWSQFKPTDPNGLGLLLTDQDATLVPTRTRPQIRDARAAFKQWPVYSRDVNALQPTDQDVNLRPVPWQWYRPPVDARYRQPQYDDYTPFAPLPDQDVNLLPWEQTVTSFLRYQGRQQWIQWPTLSEDVTTLGSVDQDVNLRPAPWEWYRLPLDARYRQPKYNDYTQFAPSLPDQDVNLVPWSETVASFLRYRGRQQWAQWPTLSEDVTTLQSTDQDITLRPVPWQWYRAPLDARWRQPTYNDYSQFAPSLPDQDVNLVPWTQTVATYQRWTGQAQQSQWPIFSRDVVPLLSVDQDISLRPVPWEWYRLPLDARYRQPTYNDYSQFAPALPDQDVNLIPWTQTVATYQRWTGQAQQSQWPVFSRDVVPLLSADQPLLDLVPWRQTTAAYLRWQGRPWNEFPVLPRDVTAFFVPDADVNIVPLLTRPQVRDARAQTKQWPVYSRNDSTGLTLPDLLSPLLVPITSPPAARWRYQGRGHFRIFVWQPSLTTPPILVVLTGRLLTHRFDGRRLTDRIDDPRRTHRSDGRRKTEEG